MVEALAVASTYAILITANSFHNTLNFNTMLGYLIVIAILGYLFVHMTMSILHWGIPEVIEHPNLSAESGIMDEIHAQDEYYSGDLGDEV